MELEKKAAEKQESSGALTYLLSGVVIGSVLGVLFAPKEGAETRNTIAGWMKDLRAQGRRWSLARRHSRQGSHFDAREKVLPEV